MTHQAHRRRAAIALLVCLAAAGAVSLAGCGSGGARKVPKPPKRTPYVCENCGHKFTIPARLPPKEEVYPPFVCPKCNERTAVRANIYEFKGEQEPRIYSYEKYTEEQIRRMEEYREKTAPEVLKRRPPEMILMDIETGRGGPMIRYEGTDRWLRPDSRMLRSPYQLTKEVKSLVQVVPEDWPFVPPEALRQR